MSPHRLLSSIEKCPIQPIAEGVERAIGKLDAWKTGGQADRKYYFSYQLWLVALACEAELGEFGSRLLDEITDDPDVVIDHFLDDAFLTYRGGCAVHFTKQLPLRLFQALMAYGVETEREEFRSLTSSFRKPELDENHEFDYRKRWRKARELFGGIVRFPPLSPEKERFTRVFDPGIFHQDNLLEICSEISRGRDYHAKCAGFRQKEIVWADLAAALGTISEIVREMCDNAQADIGWAKIQADEKMASLYGLARALAPVPFRNRAFLVPALLFCKVKEIGTVLHSPKDNLRILLPLPLIPMKLTAADYAVAFSEGNGRVHELSVKPYHSLNLFELRQLSEQGDVVASKLLEVTDEIGTLRPEDRGSWFSQKIFSFVKQNANTVGNLKDEGSHADWVRLIMRVFPCRDTENFSTLTVGDIERLLGHLPHYPGNQRFSNVLKAEKQRQKSAREKPQKRGRKRIILEQIQTDFRNRAEDAAVFLEFQKENSRKIKSLSR